MIGNNKFYFLWILVVILSISKINPQSSTWSFITSVQINGGNYIYNDYSNFYLLYGGLRYQTNDFSINGSIPVVFQNNSAFTQSGMMIIPTGMGSSSSSNNNVMHHRGGSIQEVSASNMKISLGDFYLYGSYNLIKENKYFINLSIAPNIKFPTATNGVGTGEFDYGVSVNLSKSIESFVVTAEAGFIKFGDPPGIDYKDPFIYGIGIGKFISNSGNSLLLYYNSYTQVLDGYESPRQISLGANFKLSSINTISIIGSKGLSNYSPDFSLSIGMGLGL